MSSSPMARTGLKTSPKRHLPRSPSPVARKRACQNPAKSTTPLGDVTSVRQQGSATLWKLIPELRYMIYEACLEPEIGPFSREQGRELVLSHIGPTPAFLIALRSDKLLYQEALKVYYRVNSFSLTKRNYRSFSLLSQPVFPWVRSVVVEIDGVSSRRLCSDLYSARLSNRNFDKCLFINPKRKTNALVTKFTDLRSLTFQLHANNIRAAATVVAQQLPLLSKLSEIKCIVLLNRPLDGALFQLAREEIDKLVGVKGIEAQGSRVDLKINAEIMKDAVMWVWTFKDKNSGA